jgi:hypothetical protein
LSATEVPTVTTATETIRPRLSAKLRSVAVLSAVGVVQATWLSFLGYAAYRYLL